MILQYVSTTIFNHLLQTLTIQAQVEENSIQTRSIVYCGCQWFFFVRSLCVHCMVATELAVSHHLRSVQLNHRFSKPSGIIRSSQCSHLTRKLYHSSCSSYSHKHLSWASSYWSPTCLIIKWTKSICTTSTLYRSLPYIGLQQHILQK